MLAWLQKTKGILPVLAAVNNSIFLSCRWSAKRLLDHPMFADDPEVVLLSADEKKMKLVLQVVFKGIDKHSIKFDFNVEHDTPEDVVREMVA